MPHATRDDKTGRYKASDPNVQQLLDALQGPTEEQMKTEREKIERDAKKVRDSLLSNKKRITLVSQILSKADTKNSEFLREMQSEASEIGRLLDALEKKKDIGAEKLQGLIDMLLKMGQSVSTVQDTDQSETGDAFRRNKEFLRDTHTMKLLFEQLAVDIGQNLGDFVKKNPEKIGQVGGTPLKLLLANLLGPAAPLVKILDDLVDINKQVGKVMNLTKNVISATVKEAKKLALHPATTIKGYGSSIKNGFKWAIDPWMTKNAADSKKSAAWRSKVLSGMSGVTRKLSSVAKSIGGMAGDLLSSVAGFGKDLITGAIDLLKPALLLLLPELLAVTAAVIATKLGTVLAAWAQDALGIPKKNIKSPVLAGMASTPMGMMARPAVDAARGLVTGASAAIGYESNKSTMIKAAQMAGVDPRLMGVFGKVESGFSAGAKNDGTSATGLFQFTKGTWASAVKAYGWKYPEVFSKNPGPADPLANSLMFAEMTKEYRSGLNGMHMSDTDTNMYAMQHLGAPDAKKFFSGLQQNPDAPADSTLKTAATNNPSVFYSNGRARSFKEVNEVYGSMVGGAQSYGNRLSQDAKLASGVIPDAAYIPGRKGGLGMNNPYLPQANNGSGGNAGSSSQTPKATLNTVPFMPDDNSMMSLNIAGVIG